MRIAEDGPAVGLGKIRGMRPKAKTKCMLNYNYPADLSIDRLVKLIRNTGTAFLQRGARAQEDATDRIKIV